MKRTSALLGSITLGIALTLGLVLVLLAISAEEASADDGVWAQATTQQIAVDAALSWLRSQQADDGSFGGSAGTTIDVVLALAAANEDPNEWRKNGNSPLDYLQTQAATYSNLNPASAGKLALGVIAANQTPYNFGGENLTVKLQDWYNPATGQYSTTTSSSTWDQTFAMLALSASFETVPPTATARLKSLQQTDGGWEYSAGWGSDTNSTALAMQALVAVGEPATSTALVSATTFLSNSQIITDAGFPYQNPNPWGPTESDASSTAMSIQGLIAGGENPMGAAWTKGGSTPFDALLSFQSPAGGFEGFSGPNDLQSTAQSLPAVMGKPLPIRGRVMAARKALEYIRAQQDVDGSWDTGSGTSPGAACDGIFAIVAYGDDPNTWKQTSSVTSPVDYLETYASTYPSSSAGAAGKMILAVVAAGKDPESFGGANLHTELQNHYNSGTGVYGTAPGNVSDQSWAILALDAMGKPIPPLAVNALKGMVESTGTWQWWDDRSYGTSMALMALRSAGEPVGSFYFDEAYDHMRNTLQHNDGGFPQRTPAVSPWQTDESDTNSTAFDVMGLLAGGENPQAWKWTKQLTGTDEITITVNTPMYWLLGMQNSSKAFGLKDNPTDRADNLYSTLQVVPALMHKYFPLEPVAQPAPGAGLIYLPLVLKESSP
jgi:hypothetical protein